MLTHSHLPGARSVELLMVAVAAIRLLEIMSIIAGVSLRQMREMSRALVHSQTLIV